jgi:hypothetical protein
MFSVGIHVRFPFFITTTSPKRQGFYRQLLSPTFCMSTPNLVIKMSQSYRDVSEAVVHGVRKSDWRLKTEKCSSSIAVAFVNGSPTDVMTFKDAVGIDIDVNHKSYVAERRCVDYDI